MIDYAHPTMMAEKALKDLHNAMLMRRYDEALEHGFQAIAEARLAISAIRHTIAEEAEKANDAR